jgi:hypothetical protein
MSAMDEHRKRSVAGKHGFTTEGAERTEKSHHGGTETQSNRGFDPGRGSERASNCGDFEWRTKPPLKLRLNDLDFVVRERALTAPPA